MGTSQVLGLRPSLHDKFLPKSWIYDSFFFAMHSGLSHSSPLVLQESGHVSPNREVPEATACSDRGWASAQAQRLLRWLPKCTELVPPQPDCKPGPHPSKMPSPQRWACPSTLTSWAPSAFPAPKKQGKAISSCFLFFWAPRPTYWRLGTTAGLFGLPWASKRLTAAEIPATGHSGWCSGAPMAGPPMRATEEMEKASPRGWKRQLCSPVLWWAFHKHMPYHLCLDCSQAPRKCFSATCPRSRGKSGTLQGSRQRCCNTPRCGHASVMAFSNVLPCSDD